MDSTDKNQGSQNPWRLVQLPLIQQLIVLFMSVLTPDFGVLSHWVMNAILTYWLVALPMVIFRRRNLTKIDRAFINFGFLCITIIYDTFGHQINVAIHDFFA